MKSQLVMTPVIRSLGRDKLYLCDANRLICLQVARRVFRGRDGPRPRDISDMLITVTSTCQSYFTKYMILCQSRVLEQIIRGHLAIP